ncbi:MAG: acyl-CoA reductase [Flavobacteriaceae bacterium]
MNLNQRISLFAELGSLFKDYEDNNLDGKTKKLFNEAIKNSIAHNSFFTKKNINKSLSTWAKNLTKKSINNFISNYSLKENINPKKVAIIMAGNIPLVGFHDFLCVILSGNIAVIKLSSKDYHLLNYILDYLTDKNHNFSNHFEVCNEKLNEFDAVIATGNNISADQFDLYFKNYPRIIRRNRHSIAVLEGDESNSDLELLANDIFYYYGLGCRNVSKIFIPSKYNLDKLFKSFMSWKEVINKNSYANNYDYYRAIYLLNKENFYDNGFVLLKESNKIGSPVGTIYFEYYDCLEDVFKIIENNSEKIQCVVSKIEGVNKTYLGQTQEPKIDDYADNVDTFDFLLKLN